MEEARGAGLDAERFRVDLGSHAIVEAFGADLEENRTIPGAARERGLARTGTHGSKDERLAFPALRFVPDAGAGGPTSAGAAVTTPTRIGAPPRSRRAPCRPASRRRTCPARCAASAPWQRRRSRPSASCPGRARRRSCGGSQATGACAQERFLTGELWWLGLIMPQRARTRGRGGRSSPGAGARPHPWPSSRGRSRRCRGGASRAAPPPSSASSAGTTQQKPQPMLKTS